MVKLSVSYPRIHCISIINCPEGCTDYVPYAKKGYPSVDTPFANLTKYKYQFGSIDTVCYIQNVIL